MIRDGGWMTHCIWEHSASLRELYERRARDIEPEMTCAAQAAELLAPHVEVGDTVLDIGCGSGWFFHSLRRRGIAGEYWGLDAAPSLVAIGRAHLPEFGLPEERLKVMRIEDFDGQADHVVCLNVLSNLDNYHRPLERILNCAGKTVVLRESCAQRAEYRYVVDEHLDGDRALRVHVNTYALDEWIRFIESYGFSVEAHTDRRCGGQAELVIGYPHHWTFFLARRRR